MMSFRNIMEDNKHGFTLVELLIGITLSLLLLGLAAKIFQGQRITFSRSNNVNEMQANGRAATDYIASGVMNTGYNVVRGTRFLAASDHYLAVVYDANKDQAIQNSEVFIYAVSNSTGAATENFTLTPYFDMNGNGIVSATENRTYSINLTLSQPPYNLYLITPNVGDNGSTRTTVAENIDNIIIRYYDKNNQQLPADSQMDANGLAVLPYTIPTSQLDDIRRVHIEMTARTRKVDPNPNKISSGTYTTGSVGTNTVGTTWNDGYRRQTFTVDVAPRNLSIAPWGQISITAASNPVSCPDTSTALTASLVDSQGAAVANTTMNFNTTGGVLSADSSTTDGQGNSQVTLSYDWESPSLSATVSANALVTVNGTSHPVFNAVPVSFISALGTFSDNFDDGDSTDWTVVGAVNWNIAAGQYKTSANGVGISLNGCDAWQDYQMQMKLGHTGLQTGDYIGMLLRYQNSNQYYMVRMYCSDCSGNPADDVYALQIVNYNSGAVVLASTVAAFSGNTDYYMKATIQGNDFQAKVWESSASEPDWMLTASDPTYSSGEIGMTSNKNAVFFDDVVVSPIS